MFFLLVCIYAILDLASGLNIYPEFNSKFDDVVFEVFKKVSSPKCDFLTLSVDVLPGVILVSINTRGNLVIA